MTVAEEQRANGSNVGSKGALTTAAVAAATGAAAYGLRKALVKEGGRSAREQSRNESGDGSSGARSIIGSVASSAWESASDTILPMAEEAADAAGRWVAEHAPEVVRERVLPRFIQSFNDAA